MTVVTSGCKLKSSKYGSILLTNEEIANAESVLLYIDSRDNRYTNLSFAISQQAYIIHNTRIDSEDYKKALSTMKELLSFETPAPQNPRREK